MHRVCNVLLLAALLLASPASAFWHGYTAFNGRHVQLNVPASTGEQFLNWMLNAGRWSNTSAGGSFDITRLDANGYPTSVPAGGAQVNISVPSGTVISSYILLWDGHGTLFTSGTLQSGSYSTSGAVVSFGGSSPSTVQVGISAVNSSVDYPHNIRMVANNGVDPGLLAAGQVYRPQYISIVNQAGVLRFMDAGDGNSNTNVFWADRKPTAYYTYNSYYFPPAKIVPIANVTYDGVSAYTVTWSGQTGALTDKTQMLLQLPNTQTAFPSTINLNTTGAFPIATTSGTVRASDGVTAGQWVLATFDADLQVWMVDNSGGSANTGIDNGFPPEMMILQANLAGAHMWVTPGMYQCDYGTNSISDYITNFATLANSTLLPGLQYWQEAGPNELWNPGFAQTAYAENKQTFKNGGTSAYTVTGATSGATTTLAIGANTTQVGSLLNVTGVGGITGFAGTSSRVISKPDSTHIVVNTPTTGTYTSGGTATPIAFDFNNWYGIVASNIGQAVASAIGVGNKNTRYKVIAGFQMFGGVSALGTNAGTSARIQSPFVTTNGGSAATNWISAISAATYFQPSYEASTSQMTIIEGQLAFEYPNATSGRQTAILNQYSNSTTDPYSPVNITGITPGNPTVLTVDSTVRFSVSDTNGEVTTISGVTGNIGTVLNGSTFNSPNFSILSKTDTTVTINVNTTGKVYSGGGTMTTKGSLGVNITNVYANIAPAFLLYTSTFGLDFYAYEGGQGPDRMTQDSSATIKGITNGVTTVINVGANSWDYLYNTLGQSGLTTTVSGIAAGTLATLLNGHTYTILSATPTSITINIDTSAVSSWVSGGTASYVGSNTAVNTLRNLLNYTPAAQTNTVTNYQNFAAVGAAFKYPSEYQLIGQQNYSMYFPDLLGPTLTPYRYNGMISY
jgi:hypothetical protein